MKKRISLSLTLALSVFAVALCAVAVFSGGARRLPTDSEDSYACDAIVFACKSGYMSCTSSPDGEALFLPEKTVTRAEFAAILIEYLGINPDKYFRAETGISDISDTPDELIPYVKAVCALGLMGTLCEEGKTYFMPLENVTREEGAYILGALTGTVASGAGVDRFSDIDDTYLPYMQNVKTVISLGYMIGYPDGTFRPERDMTRAELALTLYRIRQSGDKLNF